MFKIEKGIEIPKAHARGRTKYPFNKMEIGDSFFVEHERPINIRAALYLSARKQNVKITTQITKQGIRVWKTGDI